MHYFIDGYNLLFRISHSSAALQQQREQIIRDLNEKVSLLKLDVSIVFDATFQIGDRTRSHFDALEILFTAYGETADNYIIEEVKNSKYPRNETIVTSDKTLAWLVRRSSAQTQSIEDFIKWINKSYGKIKHLPVKKSKPSTKITFQTPIKPALTSIISPIKPISNPDASIEQSQNYYEQIFESRFEELMITEIKRKEKNAEQKKPKKIKKQLMANEDELSVEKGISQMEKWLQIFSKRLDSGPDLF